VVFICHAIPVINGFICSGFWVKLGITERVVLVIVDLIGNLLFHYSLSLHIVSIREAVIADLIRNLLVICPN